MCCAFPGQDRSPVHCTYFDPTASDCLSRTIIGALATVTDEAPAELAPLSAAVDVDALEQLLAHAVTKHSTAGISFAVGIWDVLVTADGTVRIYESDRPPEPKTEIASPSGRRSNFDRDR